MNIKTAIGMAVLAIISISFFYIHILKQDLKHLRIKKNIAEASLSICQNDKILTQEVSNDLQGKIYNLNKQLAGIKRLRDNPACVSITVPPGQRDAGAGRGEPSGQDGIRAEWLYDYAAEAEQYRLQLIGCQDFVNKVWNRAP